MKIEMFDIIDSTIYGKSRGYIQTLELPISLQLNRRRSAGRGPGMAPPTIAREARRADSRNPGRKRVKAVFVCINKFHLQLNDISVSLIQTQNYYNYIFRSPVRLDALG
jgi:hypothetical protein